jgi:hypothetical protein
MRAEVPEQSNPIQTATPAARRRTLTFLAIVTMTGMALIIGFEQWLAIVRDVATRNPKQAGDQLAYVIHVLAAIISLSLIGLALVVARVSWNVYVARRFPPPGMNLAFDVKVVEGLRAIWRAAAGFVTATILGALAVVMPYLLWRMLSLIVSSPTG